MAHNTNIRAGAVWTNATPVLNSEMAEIDQELFQSVNGDLGGTWNPSSPIVIGGSGLTLNTVPTFANAQTRLLMQAPRLVAGSAFTASTAQGNAIVGAATVNFGNIMISATQNGATLASVKAAIRVATHASLPSVFPSMTICRTPIGTNTVQTLHSGSGVFTPTPGSVAAWDTGVVQTWTVTMNQNNVIDTSQYLYFISLQDENGSGTAGNLYFGFQLSYTNIVDMRAA